MPLVNVNGKSFDLITSALRYSFHISDSGDLIHDHFGALITPNPAPEQHPNGWGTLETERRKEFPDHGRGDFRQPSFHVRHADGRTVTHFKYAEHKIVIGKPELDALPFCAGHMAETLIVVLRDEIAKLRVEITYCPYDRHDCVTKSWKMFNEGDMPVVLERVGSGLDMEVKDGGWEMMYLMGDWASEAQLVRRKVEKGSQGFQSSTGFSSHYANPFVALVEPNTTETSGTAYGFSYVYSGSHSTTVEQTAIGHTRVMMGLNDLHTSIPLLPGKSFQAPEIVYVYSPDGLGRMSRAFHCFYREHLASERSWTLKDRPVLINNWEATYFDFTQESLVSIAKSASELGVKLFVLDDGWFGRSKPRVSDKAGLGDWTPNPKRFPNGIDALVDQVNNLKTKSGEGMKFGIWVEPEMVNPDSELYAAHPDWVQHSSSYDRTETRNQLILNLALTDVQDYIIDAITKLLKSANIQYVKWDHNRGIHELPSPGTAHAHIVGLYRILDTLVNRFPDVLWEGCASGGGRFDPGMLYYFCQSWTSDNTDALERLGIQFGTSLVYPASSMGCHVSMCPNHQMGRTTPLEFRAHVAMMGGSFGFELDLAQLSEAERKMIPGIVALAERVNPFVIRGNMYRLSDMSSNWPAVMFVLDDQAVILVYQIKGQIKKATPRLRLQGLDAGKKYQLEGLKGYESVAGVDLQDLGVALDWKDLGDYGSKVIFVKAK